MTTSLDTIRYHSGMAGEEVADMVDELEAKVTRYEQAEELRRTNGTIVEAELREQVEKLTAERDECKNDAINGGNAGYLREQLAALAEQNEKLREFIKWLPRVSITMQPEWGTSDNNGTIWKLYLSRVCNEALSLPNLATPVLNRIKAEGMWMAAEICEHISDEYREREGHKYPELKTDAESGASECESAIRAKAAELEKSNGTPRA